MGLAPFPTLALPPDEVESAFAQRMVPAHAAAQARVAHPFLLEVDHRPLSLEEIFVASEAFDLHEAAPHRRLVVDVLEVSPTRTRLHLRPQLAMTYCAIAREVEDLLHAVAGRIAGSQMRTSRLEWVVEPVGVRTGAAAGPEC
jgi:hypothetical protein